MKNTETT